MLLSVSNVEKAFGADTVLAGVTFRLEKRERVALVGRNGCGKSTLLRIITGQSEPDRGAVSLARGSSIGYLRQEAPVTMGRTVLAEAESAAGEKLELARRERALQARVDAGEDGPELLEELLNIHQHLQDMETFALDRDVRTVLLKMGFEESEFDKQTDFLSGGEKTRLALSKLLLQEPDLLVLDEPTNHLDLQATEWLERWINSYPGAVLLVSHDRRFLDATAQRVLEMRDGQVKAYPGPFPKYLQLKAEDLERQAIVARRQAAEIEKLDEYVRRFMNSQRTAQARGRLKLMTRLQETQIQAPKSERGIAGGFAPSSRSGDLVLETLKLTAGYGGTALIKDLTWTVRRGERWGIIGENGVGKSTLIKHCLHQLPAISGRCRLGASLEIGYFSQDASDLDPSLSPIDTLTLLDGMAPPEARGLLGRFLITGDDVYRPIRTLSGGEKNKLVLARLTNARPNLLVLDEPTNHLDMDSREALAGVLKEFDGTLILISHDRWLLEMVTTHTLDIKRAGVQQFSGNYAEYRDRAATLSVQEAKPTTRVAVKPEAPKMSERELSKLIAQLEKKLAQAENEVSNLEAKVREIEAKLSDPGAHDVHALSVRYQNLQQEVGTAMAEWESVAQQLSDAEALRS